MFIPVHARQQQQTSPSTGTGALDPSIEPNPLTSLDCKTNQPRRPGDDDEAVSNNMTGAAGIGIISNSDEGVHHHAAVYKHHQPSNGHTVHKPTSSTAPQATSATHQPPRMNVFSVSETSTQATTQPMTASFLQAGLAGNTNVLGPQIMLPGRIQPDGGLVNSGQRWVPTGLDQTRQTHNQQVFNVQGPTGQSQMQMQQSQHQMHQMHQQQQPSVQQQLNSSEATSILPQLISAPWLSSVLQSNAGPNMSNIAFQQQLAAVIALQNQALLLQQQQQVIPNFLGLNHQDVSNLLAQQALLALGSQVASSLSAAAVTETARDDHSEDDTTKSRSRTAPIQKKTKRRRKRSEEDDFEDLDSLSSEEEIISNRSSSTRKRSLRTSEVGSESTDDSESPKVRKADGVDDAYSECNGEQRLVIEFEHLGEVTTPPERLGKKGIVPDGLTGSFIMYSERWYFQIKFKPLEEAAAGHGTQYRCIEWMIRNDAWKEFHSLVETREDALRRNHRGVSLCNRVFTDAMEMRAKEFEDLLKEEKNKADPDPSHVAFLESRVSVFRPKRFSEGPLLFGLRHKIVQKRSD